MASNDKPKMSEAEVAQLREDMIKDSPPVVAREFVGMLTEKALGALTDYLKAYDAPPEVLRLLNNLVLLADFEQWAFLRGTVPYHMNSGFEMTVAETINLVLALGGHFEGEDSIGRLDQDEIVPWPGRDRKFISTSLRRKAEAVLGRAA